MTDFVSYAELVSAAAGDQLVICAPVVRPDGAPALAWIAGQPDARAYAIAHSPHDQVRAAQACGMVTGLRRHVQRLGFQPA